MKQTYPSSRKLISLVFTISCLTNLPTCVWAIVQEQQLIVDDGLSQSATWKLATTAQVRIALDSWLVQSDAPVETVELVRGYLVNEFAPDAAGEVADWVIAGIIIARPDVNQLRDRLRQQRTGSRAPDFSHVLDNPGESDFVRDHVRLYLARWLAQNEFYDEALSHFAKIDVDRILDPATLLFYRGLMEHQLLKKDECVETVKKLLENASQLPRRYEVLSRLMLADIESMETDSLDEISRMMSDIRRRTGLFRSGKEVLDEEASVIKKLDKLIENLESQQQSQQAGDNTAPNSPMQDSFKSGGKGDGQVTGKQQPDGGEWGDLPPAQRAAALAEMAKDMPPHYRAVIEEYFRRLAKENDR